MPIYEYRRQDGSTFEVIQKFSDDALTTDPETGEPVERVYSAPAIHFKGSGFHNTDYGSRRRAKADSDAGGDGSSPSGSDSVDKPAGKSSTDSKPASTAASGKSEAPAGSASKTTE